MKNLLLFACCISLYKNINAQVPAVMPPDAIAFYNRAMPVTGQHIKDMILQTATAIKRYNANADSISQRLRTNKMIKGMSNSDIDGMTVLILVQASINADADLKLMVLDISRRKGQKQPASSQPISQNNTQNKTRPTDAINEMQNLKLQILIERKRRLAEEISNVMQRISGMKQDIISHLK